MPRLPIPGSDSSTWGDILNEYLLVEHNADGSLKIRDEGIPATIADGSVTSAKLASSVQASLGKADTAVQSVNGETGTAITLSAADVSAVATTQLGAASGVATLDGSSKLTSSQLPASVGTKSETKAVVNHGATASTARPSGYGSVEWIGSVEPTNAIDGDTWVDTSA